MSHPSVSRASLVYSSHSFSLVLLLVSFFHHPLVYLSDFVCSFSLETVEGLISFVFDFLTCILARLFFPIRELTVLLLYTLGPLKALLYRQVAIISSALGSVGDQRGGEEFMGLVLLSANLV